MKDEGDAQARLDIEGKERQWNSLVKAGLN